MSKTVEVSFLIGAALAGGFKAAFNNAGKLMGDLGQKMEAVSKTAGQVGEYQKLKQGIAANQTAMRDMREKSELLAQGMKTTSAQTATLRTQFNAAHNEAMKKNQVLALSEASYRRAQEAVQQLSAEMKANPSDELKKKLSHARAEAVELKGAVAQDKEEFNAAKARAKELGKQLKDSTAQEKAMSTESKRLARSSEDLRGKLDRDWESLKNLRGALSGAGVDMKNLSAEQARLASQSDRLTAAQNRLKDAQARLAATKQQLSWGNIKGDVLASAGMAMAIKAPVNTAANFEQAMSGVEAVSFAGKATEPEQIKQLEALRNQALLLGSTTQFTAMQAAQSQENLARAGFQSGEILKAMPGLLAMAAAEGMDLATAASIASNTLRGFNLDADQSNRVADVLAKTSAMTNTSISGLGEAMKYVAPVASGLGVSVEQTAALLGAMANAGIDASMGGTALRAAFTRLAKEPKAAEKALASLGVATRTTKGEMRTLPSILDEISQKTKKMGKAERLQHLANIFETQAASGMLAIMTAVEKGDIKKFEEALKPENVTGTSKAMADTRTDNLRGDLTALGSAWEGLNVVIGDVFIPTLRVGVQLITDGISKVTSLARRFPTLTKVIAGGFGAIAGLKIGSTLFKITGLLLKLPFQQVSVWLAQMAAKEALTGKTSIILAAKTKALAVAQGAWNGVMKAGRGLWDIGKLALGHAKTIAIAVATKAWAAAQWLWNVAMNANPIGALIVGIAALVAAGYYLYKNWDSVCEALSAGWDYVWAKVKAFWNWLTGIFSWSSAAEAWDGTTAHIASGWEWLKGLFTLESLSGLWDVVLTGWEKTKALVSQSWKIFKGLFTLESLTNLWDAAGSGWEDTKALITGSWNSFKELFKLDSLSGLWDIVRTKWEDTKAWITGSWERFLRIFNLQSLSDLWDIVKTGWKNAKTFVSSSWTDLKNAFLGDWAAGAWDTLTSGAAAAWKTIKSGWDTVTDWIGSGLDSVWGGMVGAWDWMWGNDPAAREKMNDQDLMAAQIRDVTMLNKMSEGFADRVAEMSAAWEPFKASLGAGFNLAFDIMTRVGDIITNNVIPAVNNLVSALGRVASELNSISQAANVNVKVNVPQAQTPVNFGAFDRGQGIAAHAAGGIFSTPHFGIVAEDGTEAIIPVDKPSRGIPLWMAAGEAMGLKFGGGAVTNNNYAGASTSNSYTGGSPTFNITVNGGEPGVAQRIRQAIEDFMREQRSYEERVAFS